MKFKWNEDVSYYTGEKVRPVKVTCVCGHVLAFISNRPAICRHCGRKVHPTKKSEFRERLIKEMKKYE